MKDLHKDITRGVLHMGAVAVALAVALGALGVALYFSPSLPTGVAFAVCLLLTIQAARHARYFITSTMEQYRKAAERRLTRRA